MNKKALYTVNLGCSKNQVDAEAIRGEFSSAGYSMCESAEDASVILINTCGFIGDAKEESIDEITAQLEHRKSGQRVVVAGCLSQRYKDELQQELPEVDVFAGTFKQGEILKALGEEGSCDHLPRRVLLGEEPYHAFLKIAEGCNRTCAFCAIPGIRGKQISFTPKELILQAQNLQEQGIQEISLIAQDLTFYGREKGGPGSTLTTLLKTLLSETDIPWFRLMYAYPAFVDDELLGLIAAEERICSYLDMPIQHASDQVLQWMRRGHTGHSLRSLLRKIRSQVPDIALRTTVLTGFPGETEDDFRQLLDLMEEIRFERLGGFAYSPEENTPAESLDKLLKLPRVDEETARNRLGQVMELQQMISLDRNQSLIGKTMKVLIDQVAEESEYHFFARSQWDAPEIDNMIRIQDGDADPGTFRNVQIVDAFEYDLDARFI